MTDKNTPQGFQRSLPNSGEELRERAEAILRNTTARLPIGKKTITGDEVQDILHELRVHQIELEMQNQELRRSHLELDESRARYFDLYDLAPLGYFTLSEKGLISEANLTAAIQLGVVRRSLVNQPLSRFVHKDDANKYYRLLKNAGKFPEQHDCTLRIIRGEGVEFYGHITVALSLVEGIAEYRVVLSDISELKRLEAEKEKLEVFHSQHQKAESLDRMAAAVAHHFNNQLQAIMMSLEMADKELPKNSSSAKALAVAVHAAKSAAEVSVQMLTYLGRSTHSFVPLDLAEECRRSLMLLQDTKLTNAMIEANLPNPGPAVRSDANQIKQVLANLLTNAWEASKGQSDPIRVAVKTVADTDISTIHRFPFDWEPHTRKYACLEVVDSGFGMDVANLEQLFDPFFTTKFTGRGLGLPVTLGIVRSHNGVITVESEPRRGSAFRVYFPVAQESPAPCSDSAGRSPTLSVEKELTILVVDDETMVRQTVANALEVSGFKTITAVDGVDALEKFQKHESEINCVICDLTMPRMNGWETLAALRRLSPAVPVILTSGYSEGQIMEGKHAERPQAFLQKPYEYRVLLEAISHVTAPINK
jgi:PAS domain S-box-containing protein